MDVFPKKIYRWPTGILKNKLNTANHERNATQNQWDITLHLSEWLSSKRPQINSVEVPQKIKKNYHMI